MLRGVSVVIFKILVFEPYSGFDVCPREEQYVPIQEAGR